MNAKEIFITIMVLTVLVGADTAYANKVKGFSVAQVRAGDVLQTPSPIPGEVNGPAKITSIKLVSPTPKPVTVKEKIASTFGDGHIMEKVAFCESSYNPKAKHKISSAKGIYQVINGTWKSNHCEGDPLNADDNIACAKKIYDRRGLNPWEASRGCWENKN